MAGCLPAGEEGGERFNPKRMVASSLQMEAGKDVEQRAEQGTNVGEGGD